MDVDHPGTKDRGVTGGVDFDHEKGLMSGPDRGTPGPWGQSEGRGRVRGRVARIGKVFLRSPGPCGTREVD